MNDGRIKFVTEKYESVFDKNGNPLESIVTMQDITIIQNTYNELVKKDEIILAQSKQIAMNEMISMIAHQWSQPLSSISMNASNILVDIELESIDENSLKKYSNNIISQTKELSRIINNFKDFFKPNQERQKININDTINNILEIMGKSLQNNNIELDLNLYNDDFYIEVYEKELMQVILNILNNAKDILLEKVSLNRKIFLKTSINKNNLQIEINDNAGGIKKEDMLNIFTPYFSTKNKKNGNGLGLYISKTIVEKHLNGTIEVINKNNGASFIIILPITTKKN